MANTALVALTLSIAGFWLWALLLRLRLPVPLAASIILGCSFVSAVGWKMFLIGESNVEAYASQLFLLLTALSLASAIFFRKIIATYFESTARTDLALSAALFFLGVAIILLPSLLKSTLGPVSISGYDWSSYSICGDVLRRFLPTSEMTGSYGADSVGIWSLIENNVFGSFHLLSFAATILKTSIFNVLVPVMALFFGLTVSLIFSFSRIVFDFDRRLAIFCTLLFAFNPLASYVATEGFLGQQVTMSVLLLLTASLWDMKKGQVLGALLFVTVLTWAIVSYYSHMLFYILPPMGLVALLSWRTLGRRLTFVLIGGAVLAAVFSPHRIQTLLENTLSLYSVDGGPSIPSLNFDVLLGFVFNPEMKSLNDWSRTLINLCFFPMLYLAMVNIWRAHRQRGTLVLSAIGLIVVTGISFRVLGTPMRGYKMFKLTTFYLPLILCILSCGFAVPKWKKYFTPALVLALAFGFFSFLTLQRTLNEKGYFLEPSQVTSLQELNKNHEFQEFNVLSGENGWYLRWFNYFLGEKKFVIWSQADGLSKPLLETPWAIITGEKTQTVASVDLLKDQALEVEPISAEGHFRLAKKVPSRLAPPLNFDFQTGKFKQHTCGFINLRVGLKPEIMRPTSGDPHLIYGEAKERCHSRGYCLVTVECLEAEKSLQLLWPDGTKENLSRTFLTDLSVLITR